MIIKLYLHCLSIIFGMVVFFHSCLQCLFADVSKCVSECIFWRIPQAFWFPWIDFFRWETTYNSLYLHIEKILMHKNRKLFIKIWATLASYLDINKLARCMMERTKVHREVYPNFFTFFYQSQHTQRITKNRDIFMLHRN